MSHSCPVKDFKKIKGLYGKNCCAGHLCRIKTEISWNRSSLNGSLFKFICNVFPGRKREKKILCLSSSPLRDFIWMAVKSPRWKLSLAGKKNNNNTPIPPPPYPRFCIFLNWYFSISVLHQLKQAQIFWLQVCVNMASILLRRRKENHGSHLALMAKI